VLRDIRSTEEFRSVADFYGALLRPGTGHIFSARRLAVGRRGGALFVEGIGAADSLERDPSSAVFSLENERLRRISAGPAKLPSLSPDESRLAFAEPGSAGDVLLIVRTENSQPVHRLACDGTIEDIGWSADGSKLFMLVAGLGADVSGHEGGYATARVAVGPDWLPDIETGLESHLWRRLWIHEIDSGRTRLLSSAGTNVWEASWCGSDRLAIVRSSHHGEGSWYEATLALIDLEGNERRLYVPTDQIGLPAGSPDGTRVAFVEAFCSDRGVVCGTLKLAELGGSVRTLATRGAEVTCVTWRDNDRVHYAGHRDFETVAGDHHVPSGQAREIWATDRLTCGEWYPASQPMHDDQCLVIAEAYGVAPFVARIAAGKLAPIHSLAAPETTARHGDMEAVRWNAADGLEIHGWLVRPPHVSPPHPTVMDIHGGPVWASRNRWMGRLRAAPLLVERGYAVLYPNPRGSSTRGQDFARQVAGDVGGADAADLLSGCDELAARGLIERSAIALTGTSYGGFMSSWLITRDPRFAAAIPISPVTDWYSQHRTSQIGFFDEKFLRASASAPDNDYFHRSPAMFAQQVRTPTLLLAGARDKNTPPGQAVELYRSLLEHGVKAELAIYPKDGHSLRGYPAYLDSAARILIWLNQHMPAARVLAQRPKAGGRREP
jgi:dipeptidyl aminopeptidase/acylaminoacyl peptidase